MKKIFSISLACLFFLLLFFGQAKLTSAQGITTSDVIPKQGEIYKGDLKGVGDNFGSVPNIIKTIFRIAIIAAGVVFVVMILIGGITYLTSAGNEDGTAKAKKMLIDAMIGLIIVLASFAIGTYILGLLGFSSGVNNGTGTSGGSSTGTTTSNNGQPVVQPVSTHWTIRDQNKRLLSDVAVTAEGVDGALGSGSQFNRSISQPGPRKITTHSKFGSCSETLNLVSASSYVTIQYNTNSNSCTMTTSAAQQEFIR